MAFKKTLVQRLFNLSRFSTPTVCRNPGGKPYPKPTAVRPEPDAERLRRVSQRRSISQSAGSAAVMRLFPLGGEGLAEKVRGMDIARGRLNLDGLVAYPKQEPVTHEPKVEEGLTMEEVKKVLKATQVEMIKGKFRDARKDWVTYEEFVEMIADCCGGNREQALMFAKTLDECGSVILLGTSVCLRPYQVAKAIQSLVRPPLAADPNDPRKKELEQLEEQKAEIDEQAEALVRRELWAGLGYMVVHTAAFMRLTFWELSWDVMEPICFYVTSAYFMLGYTFFLKTSKEPSFEGFFHSRFIAKQNKLMKAQNFDLDRYNDLRNVLYPNSSSSALDVSHMIKFDHHKNV